MHAVRTELHFLASSPVPTTEPDAVTTMLQFGGDDVACYTLKISSCIMVKVLSVLHLIRPQSFASHT